MEESESEKEKEKSTRKNNKKSSKADEDNWNFKDEDFLEKQNGSFNNGPFKYGDSRNDMIGYAMMSLCGD
jgi:hypothetical protein